MSANQPRAGKRGAATQLTSDNPENADETYAAVPAAQERVVPPAARAVPSPVLAGSPSNTGDLFGLLRSPLGLSDPGWSRSGASMYREDASEGTAPVASPPLLSTDGTPTMPSRKFKETKALVLNPVDLRYSEQAFHMAQETNITPHTLVALLPPEAQAVFAQIE